MAGRLMRTAATASMISSARLNSQKRKAVQSEMQQTAQPVAPAPQATPVAQSGNDDLTTQLQQLANLHAQGILTDAEFSAKKAKLLGI